MMRNVTVVSSGEQVTHGKVLEIGMDEHELTLRTPSKTLRYPRSAITRVIDEPADQLYEDIETRLEDLDKRLSKVEGKFGAGGVS